MSGRIAIDRRVEILSGRLKCQCDFGQVLSRDARHAYLPPRVALVADRPLDLIG